MTRLHVNSLGRFSSVDPLPGSTADPQSLNRYSYVRDMPTMLTDPTGMLTGQTYCGTLASNHPDREPADAGDEETPPPTCFDGSARGEVSETGPVIDPDPPQDPSGAACGSVGAGDGMVLIDTTQWGQWGYQFLGVAWGSSGSGFGPSLIPTYNQTGGIPFYVGAGEGYGTVTLGAFYFNGLNFGPDPGGGAVSKAYPATIPCKASAQQVMGAVESNFGDFGNYSRWDGLESVIFYPPSNMGPGSVIPIDVSAYTVTQTLSVVVESMNPQSMTFTTTPGHLLYPGSITFSASPASPGSINFNINVGGTVADQMGWNFGGSSFEDAQWNHFLGQVQAYCKSLGHP